MQLRAIFSKDIHKTVFLLIGVLVHNLIYPLSTGSGIQPVIFYAIFALIFVIAVYALSESKAEHWLITVFGLAVFVVGVTNAYYPGSTILLLLYITVIGYHAIIIIVLARYTFAAEQVMTEVILAATSLYLIIGSVFTALFGLVEWFEPGSFISSSGSSIEWQQLLYYSYVTLTTLGYGDITPVKFYAQAFAAFEAVIGVLYTVLLLSRLVSLHKSRS